MSIAVSRSKTIAIPSFNAGITFPPFPPSPVRIGNTIIVSELGSAGGARQDVTYHFKTIQQALAVAEINDLILVFPGQYIIDSEIVIQQLINIYCYSGVTITNTSGSHSFFSFQDGFLNLMGKAVIIGIDQANPFNMDSPNSSLHVECESIYSEQNSVLKINAGKVIFKVANDFVCLALNAAAIDITGQDYCEVDIQLNTAQSGFDDTGTQAFLNFNLNNGGYVNCFYNEIKVKTTSAGILIKPRNGTANVNGNRVINFNSGIAGTGYGGVAIGSVIGADCYINTAIIIPEGSCNAFTIGVDDRGDTFSAGKVFFNGNIFNNQGRAIVFNGSYDGDFIFTGLFETVASPETILIGNVTYVPSGGKYCRVSVNGKMIGGGECSQVVLMNVATEEKILLSLNGTIVNKNLDGYSVAGRLMDEVLDSVNIHSVVSNVPSDNNTVNEEVNTISVNPLVF